MLRPDDDAAPPDTVAAPVSDAPEVSPSDNVTPASSDSDEARGLDDYLAEFDSKITPETPEPAAEVNPELDELLNTEIGSFEQLDLAMDNPRERELEAQLHEAQTREYVRQETEAFAEFGRDIISKLPEELADRETFVQDKLLALRTTEPIVVQAWDLRNVDPGLAQQQKIQAEQAYQILMADRSNDPRKPALLQLIQQRFNEAEIALASKDILARASRHVIDAGRRAAGGQIDLLATEDRNAVAAAVRGASSQVPAEPPPDYSRLSAGEFAEVKRKLFRQ